MFQSNEVFKIKKSINDKIIKVLIDDAGRGFRVPQR